MSIVRRSRPVLEGPHPPDSPGAHSDTAIEPTIESILAEFTSRWDEGYHPRAEEYLGRLTPERPADVVELIYLEYCLSETAGLDPDPDEFLSRFPEVHDSLNRLLLLHGTIGVSRLRGLVEPADLPAVGDEIGPYSLVRELGRGGFARVFLAEQADLDNRLIVLKVSRQITPEPRLMARVRHPHIVEIFWHRLVEEGTLQLICMPFLGGASLSAILDGWRKRGTRPTSGRKLLAILDRVSAPEYPGSRTNRPAREIIARLSYPRAIAWIIARLAEALDHAFARGVAHGDIKPSNVLMTSDGVPMLLDFNLAVGWQYPDVAEVSGDPGGTLIYMAPERLRGVSDPSQVHCPRVIDRHRADLYSLGMVLLEALTGHPPDPPKGSPRSQEELAAAYARSRDQRGEVMIRASRTPISPALRSILAHCLAPDPADRYKRGAELADDLDRWRTDRPLLFAREPTLRFGLLRWARRQRLALIAAVISLIVVATATLAVSNVHQGALRRQALAKLALVWDHDASGTFRFLRDGYWKPEARDDLAETALRHLEAYDVVGPGDWRLRDDIRSLPEADRVDLEVWLLEQIFRYARELGERPDSPADWRRGLDLLERTLAETSLSTFKRQAHLLSENLGLPDRHPQTRDGIGPVTPPGWVEEYLLGVEAEPTRAQDALAHYRNVVADRPQSFWGHYRAAAVACRLHGFEAAIEHLKYCIDRRPENAPLHGQLATCLFTLKRYDLALEECDRALALNPGLAECYATRTYIRRTLGQEESRDRESDFHRYSLLTRHQGQAPSLRLDLEAKISSDPDVPFVHFDDSRRLLEIDPEDCELRTQMALNLWRVGRDADALSALDDVLKRDPQHLKARFIRASLLGKLKRPEADHDFVFLLRNPRLEELLCNFERVADTTSIDSFIHLSRASLRAGMTNEAILLAERGLAQAYRINKEQGRAHYNLAHVYAKTSGNDPVQIRKAQDHVRKAIEYSPKKVKSLLERDVAFKHIFPQVRPLLQAIR